MTQKQVRTEKEPTDLGGQTAAQTLPARRNGRMAAPPRGDLFARLMGVLVLLLGIVIILFVLWLALEMWRDPNLGLRFSTSPKTGPTATDIGVGFVVIALRIGLLFLGSVSGSLIANKGINLYFASLSSKPSPSE